MSVLEPLGSPCSTGRGFHGNALWGFFAHVRQRWYLYLPLLAIWMLAYLRVFFAPVPRIPLLFNLTPSLPYRVALLRALPAAPTRGQYVLYRFDGDAQRDYPGLRGQPLFKQVTGLPGDQIVGRVEPWF